MKRIHIGFEVADLESSIRFYSNLFGTPPTVREHDYAKWMQDDPCVNLSISSHGADPAGTVHFGIQVEDDTELAEVAGRLDKAGEALIPEEGAVCCYHQSNKVWVVDPDAFEWETFFTSGRDTKYGETLPELGEARAERLSALRSAK